jgi:hypothetical protein
MQVSDIFLRLGVQTLGLGSGLKLFTNMLVFASQSLLVRKMY